MRAKIGMLAGIVLVLTFACAVQAQFGMMKTPELRGVFNPVVGEGASYQIVDEKGTRQFDMAGWIRNPADIGWNMPCRIPKEKRFI